MEPVFRALEIAAGTLVRATGTQLTFRDVENIPAAGGAVIAMEEARAREEAELIERIRRESENH